MRRFRTMHYLKTSLWLVPLLFMLAAIPISLLVNAVDPGTIIGQNIVGDPAAASQILYLISFSMLTLTGLVLSLVVVVVQLAMGVFSPRIVRQILQDRPSQCVIGLFSATFIHAILTLRAVKTTTGGGSVPGVAVLLALVLVVCDIAALVWYIDHIGQSLRVAALVGWVADDTRTTMNHVYPDDGAALQRSPDILYASRGGVVFHVDHARLVGHAAAAGCVLHLLRPLGDYVPDGAPLIRVDGDFAGLARTKVLRCVSLGPERTLNQDVAYGIRMLVDIAERSLSSGPFEDPTTAVQAIDRLHDLLRQLGVRPLPSGQHVDSTGTVRLLAPALEWTGYVRIAFDEIRQAGAGSPQITRRLRSALEDLLTVVPAERHPALQDQLELLDEVAGNAAATERDRYAARQPDPAGLGSAADLVTATPAGQTADTNGVHSDARRA